MSEPNSTKRPSGFAPSQQMRRDAVAEIIRRAEVNLSGQRYASAQELLAEAWRLDPGNPYIPAIVERAQIMQSMQDNLRDRSSSESGRVLELSVGTRFSSGVRDRAAETSAEAQARLSRLLTVASALRERGAYEAAYDTILKAEELAPGDQGVKGLKATIHPQYVSALARRGVKDSSTFRGAELPGAAASMAEKILSSTPAEASSSNNVPSAEELRLADLRRQKERERLLREQQMWRQGGAIVPPTKPAPRAARQDAPPPKSGLLSSLFKGKIF